jgi:hypothetical protein
MRNENLPTPASPETPPLAPHDPPDPAPQAAAWRRALKVVGYAPASRELRMAKHGLLRTTVRQDRKHPH